MGRLNYFFKGMKTLNELKEITGNEGMDIFEMIQEIGGGNRSGFRNSLYADSYEEFQEKLKENVNISKGIGLLSWMVPQMIYWLYVDGKPVGYGKFRYYLTDKLRELGGHIGYCIRPSERKKGYGTILLGEILKKARKKGLEEVLLTCDEDNIGSRKVIENNGGTLEKMSNGVCYYWISLK